ncbi:PREDICTED: pulmonary surfactant-associated protein C-like [Branchiostoma belcheri]|uniref:Pulmonary surfactant-associated protein C-like n=1 Tax=Branchiostoma belcheri TaxID=7741 RepID=A0A6P4YB09_BRABE|nr:PREDICTED: pulmonary surfactant-associated protein C-like [Branchiostoma belcheri]
MTSMDEKKVLPSFEMGGVSQDEIAMIKREAQASRLHRLKVPLAVAGVIVILLAVGGTLLGLYLTRPDSVVRRSLDFRVDGRELRETVETDKEAKTDSFCTESAKAAGCVMYDHQAGLKAFKFTGREICYIMEEAEREARQATKMAKQLEEEEEGSLQHANSGGKRMMSLDTERTGLPVLSEKLDDFCGDLEPRWAKLTQATPDKQDETTGVEMIVPAVGDRVKRGWFIRIRIRITITICF